MLEPASVMCEIAVQTGTVYRPKSSHPLSKGVESSHRQRIRNSLTSICGAAQGRGPSAMCTALFITMCAKSLGRTRRPKGYTL